MSNRRIPWIDVAKGLLAILVVYGHFSQHCAYNEAFVHYARRMIYAFHMPAFFLLSGMVFRVGNDSFVSFVKKKISRLLVPGYIAVIVSIIYSVIAYPNGISAAKNLIKFPNYLYQILWLPSAPYSWWFLGSLFTLNILMYAINKRFSEAVCVWLSLFLLCFATCYLSLTQFINYPLFIFQALVSAPFFQAGILIQKNTKWLDTKFIWLPFAGILAACVFLNPASGNVGVWGAAVGDVNWYLMGGFSGTFLTIIIAKAISKVKWLSNIFQFFGRYSIYSYFYGGYLLGHLINAGLFRFSPTVNDLLVGISSVVSVAIVSVLSCVAKRGWAAVKKRLPSVNLRKKKNTSLNT